jgi:hypothetical protein
MNTLLADAVEAAIVELKRDFDVDVAPAGDGGAIVTVHDLEIGERWSPAVVNLEFAIAFNYPFAPIYPYYTRGDLERTDGGPWPAALQRVDWQGKQVVQISLRATRWNPDVDCATAAVAQVRRWFQQVA